MNEPEQPEPLDPRTVIVLLAVIVEGGLIVLALFLGWLTGNPPLATLVWSLSDAGVGVAATLPMLGLFFAILRWPIGPLGKIKRFIDEQLRPLLAPCSLLDLVGIAVLAGFGEEMFFRGVCQAALAQWTGNPWLALALASVLFGAMHAITLTYALFAAAMGAWLGWLWLWCDNLLPAILAHALYDLVALVLLLRAGPATLSLGLGCAARRNWQSLGLVPSCSPASERTDSRRKSAPGSRVFLEQGELGKADLLGAEMLRGTADGSGEADDGER
jgi:membrane protease YdiL (CAAX protease family)